MHHKPYRLWAESLSLFLCLASYSGFSYTSLFSCGSLLSQLYKEINRCSCVHALAEQKITNKRLGKHCFCVIYHCQVESPSYLYVTALFQLRFRGCCVLWGFGTHLCVSVCPCGRSWTAGTAALSPLRLTLVWWNEQKNKWQKCFFSQVAEKMKVPNNILKIQLN